MLLDFRRQYFDVGTIDRSNAIGHFYMLAEFVWELFFFFDESRKSNQSWNEQFINFICYLVDGSSNRLLAFAEQVPYWSLVGSGGIKWQSREYFYFWQNRIALRRSRNNELSVCLVEIIPETEHLAANTDCYYCGIPYDADANVGADNADRHYWHFQPSFHNRFGLTSGWQIHN